MSIVELFCDVDDSGGTQPYQRVDSLDWTEHELQHGNKIKIKGFPEDHKAQCFRVAGSTHRTDWIVTNDPAQDSTQATLFDMHQPNANTWIHLLHPLLNQALAAAGELPARTAEALVQKLELTQPEDESGLRLFFQDGTERPITRPKDQERQKRYYSGKKSNMPLRISS